MAYSAPNPVMMTIITALKMGLFIKSQIKMIATTFNISTIINNIKNGKKKFSTFSHVRLDLFQYYLIALVFFQMLSQFVVQKQTV